MAYCHECGSEVAENTAFCPYCGVNLQQSAVAAELGGDSSRENSVAPVENSSIFNDYEKIDSEINSEVEENELSNGYPSPLVSIPSDVYPNQNASETPATEEVINQNSPVDGEQTPDYAAVESAMIQQRIEDTGEDIEKAKYENFLIDRESQRNESEEPVENIVSPDEKEKINRFESQNESEMMSYPESEVKEGASMTGTDEESVASEPIFQPDDSVNNSDTDLPDSSPTEPINAPQQEKSDAKLEFENDSELEKSFDDNQNLIEEFEKPISKPQIELETPLANCPPPMFDSVRIMESSIPKNYENVLGHDAFELNSASSAPKKSLTSEPDPFSTKVEKKNSDHAFTAQNIANNDTDGRKSAKLKPLEEGTVLNSRYEIVRKIGGGGMGAVYLASDKNLGGVLRAVKEMVQSYIEDTQQEKAISDFKRESLLLTSLEHQSIPTIYDYFFDQTEARFYLVMKYISGGDLASRLRSAPENRIEEKTVTEWAIQIADVLDYLHNRQPAIIYRDLKPSNIMVDGNSSRVMLIDFGIARWVNKEEKGVTAVGTMGYAPPELFSGNVEPRSDIYSLGSTLFHLLTGADPQSNPLLIFDFQKHPRPRQINPQISDQMEKILMRAVEYNAEKRFASAAEFRDALTKHLENLKANKVTFGVKESPSPAAFADQPVFCGFCGQKIVATDMFCAFCGAKQPLAQKGVHLPDRSPGVFTAQLMVVGTGDLEAPTFWLEKEENLVGRRDPMSNIFPEVDLSKFDPQTKISRKHARIWREGLKFWVEDLGSSNGTLVIPVVKETVRLMPRQPFALNNGDKIRLGDTTLHFIVA